MLYGKPVSLVSVLLSVILALPPAPLYAARDEPAPSPTLAPEVFVPLLEAVTLPYNDLFDEARRLEFSGPQIAAMREYFKKSEDFCTDGFKEKAKQHSSELKEAQKELQRRGKSLGDEERKTIHCRIQNARILRAQASMLGEKAIPIAYDNRDAKLDIIEKWPPEFQRIEAAIRAGAHRDRRWGDVADIGFREIASDQEDDIKKGKEAIDEMRRSGMLPPEVEDREVQEYVAALALKVAARSDLRVPVVVTVLDSPEVNAFALPGGFLFIHRGLLEAAQDEAQLAGVIAHEIAHAAARHGHKLMRRATIASIFYQVAQIAAIIFTGGAASIGAYYALQYGFYGLGLVLSLDLLGVSREFEMEADQLGVQYAWNAGYDPTGFTRFFDRMATREGYIQGVSWFRTHPPFYQRMVETRREILYLGAKDQMLFQTTQFQAIQKRLGPIAKRAEIREGKKPSLLLDEKECPKPPMIEYKPGERVEGICGLTVPTREENKP